MTEVSVVKKIQPSGILSSLRCFAQDEDGATAIEYSIIAGLIFVAIVGAVSALGGGTSEMYTDISDTLTEARE